MIIPCDLLNVPKIVIVRLSPKNLFFKVIKLYKLFAVFILSMTTRFFAALRMTDGEFRITY